MATVSNRFSSLFLDSPISNEKTQKKNKIKKPKENKKHEKIEDPKETTPTQLAQKVITKKPITVVITDVSLSNRKKPRTISNEKVVESHIEQPKQNEDLIFEKDDRALHPRNTYKKLMVSDGKRVFDRRGGPKTSVRPHEKRHGHGQYNWGDAIETEDGSQIPSSKDARDAHDIGQYFYNDQNRGRERGSRRSYRGRESFRSDFRTGVPREPIVQIDAHKTTQTKPYGVDVDDFKSFPAL